MFFHAHLSAGSNLRRDDAFATPAKPATLGTLLRDGREALRDARTRRGVRAEMREKVSEPEPCA